MTKDGRQIVVSLTVSPIRGPDGEVVGASMIARDISDRHRTLTLASRLQALTSALSKEITTERALDVLLDQAVAALGADAGAVGLVNPDGTRHRPRRERRPHGPGALGMGELPGRGRPADVGRRPQRGGRLDDLPRTARRALPRAPRVGGGAVPGACRDSALGRGRAVRGDLAQLLPGCASSTSRSAPSSRPPRSRPPTRSSALACTRSSARPPGVWPSSPMRASCSRASWTRTRRLPSSPTSPCRGSPTGAGSSWSTTTARCATSPSPTPTPIGSDWPPSSARDIRSTRRPRRESRT